MPDWEAIKTAYITGQDGHRSLARKFGVGASTLSARASRDGWSAAREQYRAGIVQKAVSNAAAAEVDKLGGLMQAADKMCGLVTDVLSRDASTMGASDVRQLAAAIKDMTTVIRNLYDIPTKLERAAQEMAAKRLELEAKRADNKDTGGIQITLAGDAEDLAL